MIFGDQDGEVGAAIFMKSLGLLKHLRKFRLGGLIKAKCMETIIKLLPETEITHVELDDSVMISSRAARRLTEYLVSKNCKLVEIHMDWVTAIPRANWLELMDSLTANHAFGSCNLFYEMAVDLVQPSFVARAVPHFVKLNQLGRRLIRDPSLELGHVPLILEALTNDKSILFDILRSRPDFVKRGTIMM
jgi:hypothetical protein